MGLVLVLGVGVLTSWGASAQPDGDGGGETKESVTGSYFGLGVGFGFDNFDAGFTLPDLDPGYGIDVWTGYRIVPFAAIEAQLEYLNGFSISGAPNFNVLVMTANGKVYPLSGMLGPVDPFAYAGVGFQWLEIAGLGTTGFAARFGFGLDFRLTDRLALNGSFSYVLPTGSLDGADYYGLVFGVQF